MGRAYRYPPGSRAAIDARLTALGITARIAESDEAVEVLLDDGPSVIPWERNQPVSATLVEPVPDGAASRLRASVPVAELQALLAASNDTQRIAAAKALKLAVTASRTVDLSGELTR